MAALLKRGLEEHSDTVDVATSGPHALWFAMEFAYDAVLLDAMLPGRGEVELELSTKEFAMLRLFLSNPGVVLSRARILEHVWDYAYDGVSNIVDQCVRYLRRKIDRPFAVAQLETVRGAGYRLGEHAMSMRADGRTAGRHGVRDRPALSMG